MAAVAISFTSTWPPIVMRTFRIFSFFLFVTLGEKFTIFFWRKKEFGIESHDVWKFVDAFITVLYSVIFALSLCFLMSRCVSSDILAIPRKIYFSPECKVPRIVIVRQSNLYKAEKELFESKTELYASGRNCIGVTFAHKAHIGVNFGPMLRTQACIVQLTSQAYVTKPHYFENWKMNYNMKFWPS